MSKADQLTPAIKQALDEVLNKHLKQHPIWQGKFFTAIEKEPDAAKRWELLETWIDQMPHASYGFTTYVSFLAARTSDTEVRELLVDNLFEEHHSPQSHFKMICGLKGKVQGSQNTHAHEFDSLLPTSRAHVATHTALAKDGDFFEGLGTLLLIENLTAEEFRRVRESCANTWEELGKKPKGFFGKDGGGTGYFTANEDADAGHGIDMMIAVQEAIKAEGVDVNDAKAIRPYIERITRGVITSITCRTRFVEGVHKEASKNVLQEEYIKLPNKTYRLQILPNGVEVMQGQHAIYFPFTRKGVSLLASTSEAPDAERIYTASPFIEVTGPRKTQNINLKSCGKNAASLAADFITTAQKSNLLDHSVKAAFGKLWKAIPKTLAA
jgi:pyrroloquinoline quinone (PQQ) biosynthesis protein C